ncbi:MAG: hypothetical protein GF341_05300 [candidate division Zixibacteria bacterium]|nr:hypothetical protein [candidate division Zixibacteria bacterium]
MTLNTRIQTLRMTILLLHRLWYSIVNLTVDGDSVIEARTSGEPVTAQYSALEDNKTLVSAGDLIFWLDF